MGVNLSGGQDLNAQNSENNVNLAGFDNKGYILTTVNDVINWSRTGSLYCERGSVRHFA